MKPLAYIYPYPMSPTSMSESCRWLCYRIRQKSSTYHSREIGKILLLLLYYYHMDYIWMIIGDRVERYFGSGLVRHSSEARIAFVLPMSIEDRLLLWMVVRSQTYYPEHTCLWKREGSLRFCRRFWLFLDRLIGGGKRWRSNHHTKIGSQVWGLGV